MLEQPSALSLSLVQLITLSLSKLSSPKNGIQRQWQEQVGEGGRVLNGEEEVVAL
jgi:hypothetical protein